MTTVAYYMVGHSGRRKYERYELAVDHARILGRTLYAYNASGKVLWTDNPT